MDAATFQGGFDVATYVGGLRNYRSFVRALMDEAATYMSENGSEYAERLRRVVSAKGPLVATIMTEDWCGDSACNLPIIAPLLDAAGIELRVLRGSENDQLQRLYRDRGDTHIPVISFWRSDFSEAACWIEAPELVDERKTAWKKENPRFTELYEHQHEDRQAAREFATVYREFLEMMAGWYRDGMWRETMRELAEAVEAAGRG